MTKSDALGPSVWVASDGRAGNAAQVLAIARALGEMSRWVKIAHINGKGHRSTPVELTPRGLQPILPSRLWWSPLAALPGAQRAILQKPWPTLWIGAGRKTAPYSAYVKKASGDATLCVHVMNPQLELSAFDLVIAPEHDGLTGENVMAIIGAPAYFAPDVIEDAELAFADMAEERGFKVAVILGGDSKSHKMTDAAVGKMIADLKTVAASGARLRIVCSRRTPTAARVRFRQFAEETGARFWESMADGPNPYLAYLLMSDAAIVTEDSTNMLSEAAYFGLPLHIARMEGSSPKFDRFHKALIDRGIAKWFEGEVSHWHYPPLREIDRVADEIVKQLQTRHKSPDFNNPDGARMGGYDRR